MFLQRGERIDTLEDSLSEAGVVVATSAPSPTIDKDSLSEDEIRALIEESVSQITPPPAEVQVIEKQNATSSPQVSFVPMGGVTTTTSSDWTDVPGSEVSLDLINDYGKDATVSFEGFLKVAHSNGKAFARLFDDTHKIAVDGSEISIGDTDTLTIATTKNLPIWAGRNIYKIQVRSLNSFEVTYGGGKLKIVH